MGKIKKSVISVCTKAERGLQMHVWAVIKWRKLVL